MLDLNNEILEHLRRGGTVLVPSRQRATAVRVAFSAAMLAGGLRVWSTPDVLPWAAWLERELDAARSRGETVPRRLSPQEEWLLWQEAVHEACSGFDVLAPDAMIEPVRRAAGLLDDYGLTLVGSASAEAAVLQTSCLHFMRRCQELHVLGGTSWRELREYLRPSANLLLAGFSAVGPARRSWLAQHGVRIATETLPSGSMQVVECESPAHEAEAAAQWCARLLAQDPRARLLIVVPRLAEQRHLWERSFSQRLDHASILSGDNSSGTATHAIEGGRPLTGYRLVATALHLLALASGCARFNELSAVLRSPYLSALDRGDCLRIDRWLRERNVDTARSTVLRALLPLLTRDLKDAAGATLLMLIEALEAVLACDAAAPSQWARQWVALLEKCGWPGRATLSGDEQQARMRFDEVLGDFAAVAVPARQLGLGEAFRRLHQMTQRVSFEPATDDVPVTISARLEDPIVRYDGLWVAGLTADAWPPPARPDSLLPLAMQHCAGIAEASADGQLQLALQLQQRWQRSANHLICSWFRSTKDLPHDRSPLIEQPPVSDSVLMYRPAADTFSLQRWQVAHAPLLESWRDVSPPALTVDGVLKGGTRLLELQSLCPFRAFAELRLKALPLEQPSPGIDAGIRGKIVHNAVELFWRHMGDQATLRASSAVAIRELTDRCVAQAMQIVIADEPGDFPPELLRREHLRTENLLAKLIEWELTRPAFATQVLESTQRHEFSGATLELRLDRVDYLEGGGLLVIDYKSGKPKKFDALAQRLTQPQLPAYAVVSGPQAAAVASVFLGREGIAVRGLADRPDRIPRLPNLKEGEPSWAQLMQLWQQQLHALTQEFLRGEAAVRPQPDACKFCHLQILCRIDPASVPRLEEGDEADAGVGADADVDADVDIDAEEFFE